MRFSLLRVLVLFQLFFMANLYAEPGLKRLTWNYEPNTWVLFKIQPNPFSPVYRNEISIASDSRLSIKIFKQNKDLNKDDLLYNVIEPDDAVYPSAVYEFNWDCICDSNGMPVRDSVKYKILFVAYSPNDIENILWQDSLEVFVFDSWEEYDLNNKKVDIKILPDVIVTNDNKFKKTKVAHILSDMYITNVSYEYDYTSNSFIDIVAKFSNRNKFSSNPFRRDARGYICKKDTNSIYGYKIIKEIQPFRGIHSVWSINLQRGEYLMIICVSHWPVMIDVSNLINEITNYVNK